jgi:hypothetical protein
MCCAAARHPRTFAAAASLPRASAHRTTPAIRVLGTVENGAPARPILGKRQANMPALPLDPAQDARSPEVAAKDVRSEGCRACERRRMRLVVGTSRVRIGGGFLFRLVECAAAAAAVLPGRSPAG